MRAAAHSAWRTARDGAAPPPPSPSAALAFGFFLPAAVLRAALGDPDARRRYLKNALVQLALVAAVLAAVAPHGWHGVEVIRVAGGTLTIRSGGGASLGASLGVLYALLVPTEWIVLWLFREHNDRVIHDLCALAGVPPEDAPKRPRVRLHVRWALRRLRYRLSGLVLALSILPWLVAFALVPVAGRHLQAVASTLWATYWLAVLTAGKSQLAWQPREASPWFLRGYGALTERVFLFRWWLPRAYGRLWRRVTAKILPAALTLEEAPWAFAGLLAARVAASVPGLSLFLRPLVTVAATHVIHRTRAASGVSAGQGAAIGAGDGP